MCSEKPLGQNDETENVLWQLNQKNRFFIKIKWAKATLMDLNLNEQRVPQTQAGETGKDLSACQH